MVFEAHGQGQKCAKRHGVRGTRRKKKKYACASENAAVEDTMTVFGP
jgi:hypothetical protein